MMTDEEYKKSEMGVEDGTRSLREEYIVYTNDIIIAKSDDYPGCTYSVIQNVVYIIDLSVEEVERLIDKARLQETLNINLK